MYITRYSCHILMKLQFSVQIFEKFSNIKFHEDLFGGSRVVPCRRTVVTTLVVIFRSFATAAKNVCKISGFTTVLMESPAF